MPSITVLNIGIEIIEKTVTTELLKVAKPKFRYVHFQEFCDKSISLSYAKLKS